MTNAAYLASAGLCIGSIACLSQQSTARMGNALGLIGVSSGIAATVGLLPSDPAILAQIAGMLLGASGQLLPTIGRIDCLCMPRQAIGACVSTIGTWGPYPDLANCI